MAYGRTGSGKTFTMTGVSLPCDYKQAMLPNIMFNEACIPHNLCDSTLCCAGPENVDLEDAEMQGVMPRAINQVMCFAIWHQQLPCLAQQPQIPCDGATGVQRAEASPLA